MAQFDMNPAFERVRKRLGNIVFYTSEGDVFARRRPGKRSASTPAQEEIQAAFKKLAGDWKFLEGIIQESWNLAAKNRKRLQGYAAFLGANVTSQRGGVPLELSKSMGVTALAGFNASTGTTAGEIVCSFTTNAPDTTKPVTIFYQKKVNGSADGPIVRTEVPPGHNSSVTITGLAAGAEYQLYAVVTDRAFDEAERVSASVSAAAVAGL